MVQNILTILAVDVSGFLLLKVASTIAYLVHLPLWACMTLVLLGGMYYWWRARQ